MNFIDSTRTTRPVVSFEPRGDHAEADQLHLLHGALPGEVVCTENFTPFLKMLPCKGKAGISSLFDGHKLFDASWQSMSIDVRPTCPPGQPECLVEIEQTVAMVLDIDRSKRPRGELNSLNLHLYLFFPLADMYRQPNSSARSPGAAGVRSVETIQFW
jgi:phosphatidylinositol glycan class T